MATASYTHTAIQTPMGEVNIHQVSINQTFGVNNNESEIIDVEPIVDKEIDLNSMPSTYALPINDLPANLVANNSTETTAVTSNITTAADSAPAVINAVESTPVSGSSTINHVEPATVSGSVTTDYIDAELEDTNNDVVEPVSAEPEHVAPEEPAQDPITAGNELANNLQTAIDTLKTIAPNHETFGGRGTVTNLGNVGFKGTTVGSVEII